MRVVLVYNSTSGGAYTLRRLKPLLRQYGVVPDYSFKVSELHSKKLAELLRSGVTVMCIGGDGTLNATARRVIGTKSTLFPLPGGTFNHFVRDLGMAPTIEDNLAALKTAKTVRIDVGFVNDELFLNNSNLGMYPFSIVERKRTKKLFGKWPAAILSAIDQLVRFRMHRLRIDGAQVRSPFMFVGNNIFDIKASLIPQRSKLTDGVLTVIAASTPTRRSLLKALLSIARGDVSKNPDVSVEHRESIEIFSHRPELVVSYDGEAKKLSTPLRYSVKPKSLKVLVVTP